jgi:hypothetical protein
VPGEWGLTKVNANRSRFSVLRENSSLIHAGHVGVLRTRSGVSPVQKGAYPLRALSCWSQFMMKFEEVINAHGRSGMAISRCKVPGGWLILLDWGGTSGITFYPDPDHVWDGSSIP